MTAIDYPKLRFLLTDVDDTLTTEGRLEPATYQALWRLAEAGVRIIPITGGCAGWCDQMARTWPVAGVIGEGGGFYLSRAGSGPIQWRFWADPEQHRADQSAILDALERLHLPFETHLARDQAFRLVDVAIDYNQDARLDADQADQLCRALIEAGFNAKRSSIHVNVWRGAFNKCAMARRMLAEVFDLDETAMRETAAFIGDAPNDETMFEFFPASVGVANIQPHLAAMTHRPARLTRAASGAGFVELAEDWLAALAEGRA